LKDGWKVKKNHLTLHIAVGVALGVLAG